MARQLTNGSAATSENALTAHLVVDDKDRHSDSLLRAASELLHDSEIRHVTLQLETQAYAGSCSSTGCS